VFFAGICSVGAMMARIASWLVSIAALHRLVQQAPAANTVRTTQSALQFPFSLSLGRRSPILQIAMRFLALPVELAS
jgi:hypothetical protein